ncbi:MAG: tetratricopeptide repeat protein [Bacteroidota bacterium]
MKIRILLIAIFFVIGGNVQAQTAEEAGKMAYNAYLQSSLTLWGKAIDAHKKVVAANPVKEAKFELAKTYHGYLNATMADQNEEAFKSRLEPAKELLEELIDDYPAWGEPKAVMSSVMGLEMAYSPMKGAFLGMKSGSLMSKAMKESPDSPLVMKLYGGSKQYTPAMWGGNKKEAAEYLQKSVSQYEANGDTQENWQYADALANLGIVYTSLERSVDAKATFEKALVYEPDFYWVKASLLPNLAQTSGK